MVALDKEMAPREPYLPGTRPTEALGGTTVDEIRISPGGDAFYAVAKHRPATDEKPHGCALCMSSGFVFFGIEEGGEEEIELLPCRRCRPEALR